MELYLAVLPPAKGDRGHRVHHDDEGDDDQVEQEDQAGDDLQSEEKVEIVPDKEKNIYRKVNNSLTDQ